MPLTQMSEQHCAEKVQACSMPRHTGPASFDGGRQVPAAQVLPSQHAPLAHEPPWGTHEPPWQRSTPPSAGRQSLLSQHWSLNWQRSPSGMQQGASPV